MRPRSLGEVVGQTHLLAEGKLLPKLVPIEFLWKSFVLRSTRMRENPASPEAIANETESQFIRINAVMSNVAELRQVLGASRRKVKKDTVLFIDEIHRFNKSQQDLLLPDVEAGNIRLIGATTHNPGFYVNAPLLSRSHLFRLEPHTVDNIARALERALEDSERGLGKRGHSATPEALRGLAKLSDGDLRRAFNALEVVALGLNAGKTIEEGDIAIFASERQIRYDSDEDDHYDTISAFIKSMAVEAIPMPLLYWLAKMLAGGEDPRFIGRRLIIFASEDVGLADVSALAISDCYPASLANSWDSQNARLIWPIALFIWLTAPKSNASYAALGEAKRCLTG